MNDELKALNYYRAAVEDRRPDYVPAKVMLRGRVYADYGEPGYHAGPGEMACDSNQWGAVSVKASNGKMLGVRPKEFEVLEWRANPATGAGEDHHSGKDEV